MWRTNTQNSAGAPRFRSRVGTNTSVPEFVPTKLMSIFFSRFLYVTSPLDGRLGQRVIAQPRTPSKSLEILNKTGNDRKNGQNVRYMSVCGWPTIVVPK